MPLRKTRVEMRARIRRDGQFRGAQPTDDELDSYAYESISWWWTLLGRQGRSGVGQVVETVVATPGQSFVLLPDSIRAIDRVTRSDWEYGGPVDTTRIAQPSEPHLFEYCLPGVYWEEYRAVEGQLVELRPIPETAITVTLQGLSEPPPKWTDDIETIDIIDETHERALVDVTIARASYRDDKAARDRAIASAQVTLAEAVTAMVDRGPTHWTEFRHRR